MGADLIAAFTTAFNGVKTDATSILTAAIPIALGIGAMVFIGTKGFKWFKKLAG